MQQREIDYKTMVCIIIIEHNNNIYCLLYVVVVHTATFYYINIIIYLFNFKILIISWLFDDEYLFYDELNDVSCLPNLLT